VNSGIFGPEFDLGLAGVAFIAMVVPQTVQRVAFAVRRVPQVGQIFVFECCSLAISDIYSTIEKTGKFIIPYRFWVIFEGVEKGELEWTPPVHMVRVRSTRTICTGGYFSLTHFSTLSIFEC
jgi:hypothetical protein